MEKLFPIGKVGIRMLSPVSKTLFKVEMPNKTAVSEVEKLYVKLMELQELLKDREITSVRIVTTPEKMVIEETKRNYMYLNLYNFNVDGLYINRILPQNVNNPFFDRWLMIQREYVDYLRQNFAALPVYEIPWYDEELKGVANVCRIVRDVLDEKNVFETRILTERETFAQTENGYELKVFLPNAEKEKIDLYQAATDIVIKTGNFKRNIPLPNILRKYVVTGAKFEGNYLRVQFEKEADGEES